MSFSHAKKSPRDYGAGYRDELERFKTAINLTEYAASQGYQLDKRASSRNSVVMRHPAGDKVVIARNDNFLFGAPRTAYVCKITDKGLTACADNESP